MSLRSPLKIVRRAVGSYVDGRFVPGASSGPQTIMASVQPAKLSDYNLMEALSEGRRVEKMVRVYTDAHLTVAGDGGKVSGDTMVYCGQTYEFVADSPWQAGVMNHHRYLAAATVPAR